MLGWIIYYSVIARANAMQIDPVILLIEDLRLTEGALQKATKSYSEWHLREDGELVNFLLSRLKRLYRETYEILPTSSVGAAELLRLAAHRLPFAYFRYGSHLHEVADRLSDGNKLHRDLVWLRALSAAIDDGALGKDGSAIVRWLQLAVAGASRPVIVYRAVRPGRGSPPWRDTLHSGGNAG